MTRKKIYILHEYGSNSHYRALSHLCDEKGIDIIYREFSIAKSIIKSIIRLDTQLLKKQILNILFLFSLLLFKDKKIVLGIAPYDFRLVFLRYILKGHKVYYHTSWTCWDKSHYPKKLFVSKYLIKVWVTFLQKEIVKIFSVTEQTKSELLNNVGLQNENIQVVYHSFDDNIFYQKNCSADKNLNFIYVGRLTKEKGVNEILDYFSKNMYLNLSLVGDGPLKNEIINYANKFENIKYLGYISNQKELSEIYNQHQYLLLNSKKVETWEELFGMVLIEAMACGVVPIATNHKGPKEIITDGIDGFLSAEENFINKVHTIINSDLDFTTIQNNAILSAKQYSISEIAKKWSPIFE